MSVQQSCQQAGSSLSAFVFWQVKRKVKVAPKKDEDVRIKDKETDIKKSKELNSDDREELDFQFDEELDNMALGTHRTNKFTDL